MERLMGVVGLLTMMALAYAFSTNRRAIRLKTVLWGVGLQFFFALFVLRVDVGRRLMAGAGYYVQRFLELSYEGSKFVFGQIGIHTSDFSHQFGRVFAFQVLPTIIFVAAFFAILYHFGIMQPIIRGFAVVMTRVMRVSGAESVTVAASVFGMGQTEAPLVIRPYLARLTQSELMTIMTSGFAHVAGGVMAAYIAFGIEAKHLLTAVVMTAPGTLLLAKMLVPETGEPETAGEVRVAVERVDPNVLGAAARGTTDGLYLALNVTAMLVAFLALIAFVNAVLGGIDRGLTTLGVGFFPANLEQIFGWVFRPVAWVIGIPWHDAGTIGNLMGLRMVTNEFIAFVQLGELKQALDPRSFTIATYALCGFANFGSIGIQIGGIGALVPERRGDLARLGFRAMIAGTMANFMSAAIAGILL